MPEHEKNQCVCECGSVSYAVTGKPLFRMFCHCSICQKFNDADFGDIFVYRAADVEQPDKGLINFETYRPPPNVQRGKCTSCNKPAIEVLESRIMPNLIMVPANMLKQCNKQPPAFAHVFYDGRVADVQDDLPKYSGYLKSQLMFGKQLLKALL